jgi:hypothetical protein
VRSIVELARAAGLTSYCDSSLHAADLRNAHKARTDHDWVYFLARAFPLSTDLPPAPPLEPFCT